jgi:antirestriction protein ArdC
MQRHAAQPADTPTLGGVYGAITDQIVADLEAGVHPWHQPGSAGNAGALPLRHNGEPYSGINVFML